MSTGPAAYFSPTLDRDLALFQHSPSPVHHLLYLRSSSNCPSLRSYISTSSIPGLRRHSQITQLYAILEAAQEQGVPHTYVHFFGDWRDTDPHSAGGYCGDLLSLMGKEECESSRQLWDGITRWTATSVMGGEANYENDVDGEFLKPIIVNRDAGRTEVRPFRPDD
ncbi:Phosphoglycerate mutase [Mycena venus]|uniref:Phosphoglycerate mutase n=1 Tax=Mycena venus TaxID=2733690 RepID=A0A8H6Z3G9_9AGAR|nr:Phosphoglycerate mutase [Mycena venus]